MTGGVFVVKEDGSLVELVQEPYQGVEEGGEYAVGG